MNIFYLHSDAKTCAEMHVDKHVVKMILEYAQLLSTAHRVLDGSEHTVLSASGRKKKVWHLDDAVANSTIYSATHINHPSAKWARHTVSNYKWLYSLLWHLCKEYTYRYGKTHLVETKVLAALESVPKSIPDGEFTPPWRAMPDEYKVPNDTIASYRNYYVGAKSHFAKWSKRNVPQWFSDMLHTSMNMLKTGGDSYANLRLSS